MGSFAEQSRRSQLLHLRKLAEEAVRRFGLRDARLTPVQHWLNTTYQVNANGQRYALRIQRAEQQDWAEVQSELVWVQMLRAEAGLEVPQPMDTIVGGLLTSVEVPGVPEPRICVLFRWLDGRSAYKRLTPELMSRAGEFLAHMHMHSERFEPQEGFTRPRWDAPAFGDGALNVNMEKCRARVSGEQWDVIVRMGEVVRSRLTAMPEERRSFGMIHADFHPGNPFFCNGGVRAIDFDLCGWGYYLYDIAVMLSVLVGRHSKYEVLCAGFVEGYRRVRTLPGDWEEIVQMFIAARKMIRALWLAQQIGLPVWTGVESRVEREIDYVRSYLRNRVASL
jgi:Ser/Thr protein kinase RdoA (MazF antagonist)